MCQLTSKSRSEYRDFLLYCEGERERKKRMILKYWFTFKHMHCLAFIIQLPKLFNVCCNLRALSMVEMLNACTIPVNTRNQKYVKCSPFSTVPT